ncbi:regulatory protein RecX [Qingrenia yutianensis]|uniref:Regulatory protein RecX n=1 Tax=Qingrenia yutianensis TaxID=2763676 RepID=A0A926FD38_9FIRM|nr:regulatory protein RecX [Qingrenia yutianensis]MBC8596109.1 regulatory protein RecX [Qingrenia yutianensis]
MKITDITPQKNNKNRVSVFVDGKYSFSLDDTDMVRLKVKIGSEITENEIEIFNKECNLSKARMRLMQVINRKAASRKMLFDDLAKHGYDREIIDIALDEFERLGYIDDEVFALEYAKSAYSFKRHGKIRIVSDLTHKGVPREIAQNAVDDLDTDERSNIEEIIRERFMHIDFSDYKEKQRVVRYFASRGFNFSDIFAVIDRFK